MKNAIQVYQDTKLSEQSLLTLEECEKIIDAGIKSFMQIGQALEEIKRNKLYLEAGYATYNEYCQQRWQFTPQHSNRLIQAYRLQKIFESEPMGSFDVPESERQLRELQYSDDPVELWKEAQRQTGEQQPTASQIKKVREGKKADQPTPSAAQSTHNKLKKIIETPYEKRRTERRAEFFKLPTSSDKKLRELAKQRGVPMTYIVEQGLELYAATLEEEEVPTS